MARKHVQQILADKANLFKDLNVETRCTPFFDAFYKEQGYAVERFEYHKHLDEQRHGIDVKLTKDGKTFLIDEKATVGDHDDFPIEICHEFDDARSKPGCMLNPDNQAQYFLYFNLKKRTFTLINAKQLREQCLGELKTYLKMHERHKCNNGYTTYYAYVPFGRLKTKTVLVTQEWIRACETL